jgi:hypothetical protein
MDLSTWLFGSFALGLLALAVMVAFVKACEKV